MKTKYIKEIGIIASYVWLIIAVYFFDWKPLSIFLSFLTEFAIVFFIYWFLINFSDSKNKRNVPGGNVLLAGLAMIGFQFFLISLLATSVAWDQFLVDVNDPIFSKAVVQNRDNMLDPYFFLHINFLITFLIVVAIYVIRIISMKEPKQRENYLQENLFFQAIVLTGMNVIGFFAIEFFTFINPFPILIAMVTGRIFMELYINNWKKKSI